MSVKLCRGERSAQKDGSTKMLFGEEMKGFLVPGFGSAFATEVGLAKLETERVLAHGFVRVCTFSSNLRKLVW